LKRTCEILLDASHAKRAAIAAERGVSIDDVDLPPPEIPNSVEGLTALPGVGPKMAYLVMNVAWER
jgi:endonuclease III